MDRELSLVLKEETKTLLDSQLSNLSNRMFEAGKVADQQLTAWLTFGALTILLCFGVSETVSIGGLQLKALVAAAVTFILSCAFYYRANLSMAALQRWRELLRERRRLRFATLIETAKIEGAEVLGETMKDVNAFVSEYPGYLACSVLIKEEAKQKGGALGAFVASIHYFIIGIFSVSPYILAFALVYRSRYSIIYLVIVALGLMVTLSANAIMNLREEA
jgi:hypothetical protein